MKTSQKTLTVLIVLVALCALIVAVVSAAPAAPNGPITISKTVSPKEITLDYTGVLTYTIMVTNTATPGVLNAFMEDTLPTPLSFGEWVEQPLFGTMSLVGDTILWTGPIAAPPVVVPPVDPPNVLVFVFTANLPGPESITLLLTNGKIENTAYAGHMDGTVYIVEDSDSAATTIRRYIYLPLVMRELAQ
jgi:uncharacterized repeat protein (TIGR01451 family)